MAAAGRGLAELTRATFVNGRWRKAAVNGRAVNRLRKAAAMAGADFELPQRPVRQTVPREKGHKHERVRLQRYGLRSERMD